MEDSKNAKTTEVYALLKERIVSMQYMPGQILMVQHLASEYGFSRTPVREALVRLRDEGLLEASGGRKFRVNQITWKLVSDIYDARLAIETQTVRRVAENRTPEQLAELERIEQIMEQCCREQQYRRYFETDLAFHDSLMKYAGNAVLISWMNYINDQQQRIRYLTSGIYSNMERSFGEHRRIIEKIREQDADGAAEMMKQHLFRARQDMLALQQNALLCGIRD